MHSQSLDMPIIAVNGSPLAMEQYHSPTTISEKPASSRSSPKSAPPYDFTYEKFDYNLIVYIYQDDGVLVQAVPTYEEAIDIAIREFPQLKTVPREDITICYQTASNGRMVFWRISESAWANSARKFQPRTKLQIVVRGDDKTAGPSNKPPPYEAPLSSTCAKGARTRSASPRNRKHTSNLVSKASGTSISSFFKRI